MNKADAAAWIDAYVETWRTPGTDGLSRIFTEDATYRVSPWKKPNKGLEEIASLWDHARVSADEKFSLDREITAVDGDVAVAKIEVNYLHPFRRWRDLWIMRFAPDGRCSSFEEWPFSPDQSDGHE
jgi:hypothetical protein